MRLIKLLLIAMVFCTFVCSPCRAQTLEGLNAEESLIIKSEPPFSLYRTRWLSLDIVLPKTIKFDEYGVNVCYTMMGATICSYAHDVFIIDGPLAIFSFVWEDFSIQGLAFPLLGIGLVNGCVYSTFLCLPSIMIKTLYFP